MKSKSYNLHDHIKKMKPEDFNFYLLLLVILFIASLPIQH